jgi:flagellar motility protein MotE (MotC chaperone)
MTRNTPPRQGATSPPRNPRRDLARGARRASTLLFLSLCFMGSAAVRLGDLGMAVAQEQRATGAPPAAAAANEPTVLRPDAVPLPDPDSLSAQAAACDAEPGPLLVAIRERVVVLEQREERIAERERLLEVTEARIRDEIARLEETEQQLADTLALADGASERDVAHLVGVYESMKSKDAAVIFTAMDPQFAAGFLSRMRADAAGGILGAMDPGAAYAVTAVMAGRHVGAGRDPRTGAPAMSGP